MNKLKSALSKAIAKSFVFFDDYQKEIMTISCLTMVCCTVWSLAIVGSPAKTYEDTLLEFDDEIGVPLGLTIEDEEVSLGLCPYQDIATHWAKDNCMKAIQYQIMNPISDTEFGVSKSITRGEFITILGRLENIDTEGRVVKTFKDVKESDFFYPYVSWAESNNILANEKNKKFRPNDLITREEMATMMRKYLENVRDIILTAGPDFIDQDQISNFAIDSVMLVTGSGYLSGRTNNTFDPKSNVSRGEIATLMVRLIEDFGL